jgi:hypothetical protein
MVQRIKTGMIADDAVTAAKLSPDADNISVFRNRIINGDMRIDQRNGGASVSASGAFPVDRYQIVASQASKFTAQQNAGSVTPPAGFTNYLGITSSSSYAVLTGDYFSFQQYIEGFNIADLGWGTTNAKTVTLSFWARSSLTGTFGGALRNDGAGRCYPFTYTISSANNWEYKTVTITGDTTGTWLTTNGRGIGVQFGLGVGSTFSGTAGEWAATNYVTATGATSVVGTDGATFYITGVQLEVGTQATSFEYRQFGTELALCQRYCQIVPRGIFGRAESATVVNLSGPRPVPMRGSTTLTKTANGLFNVNGIGQVDITGINSSGSSPTGIYVQGVVNGNVSGYYGYNNADGWAFESAEL